jgi:type I restriction enzyme S subunit
MSYSKWTSSDFGNNQLLEIIDGDRGKNYPNGEDFQNAGYCIFLNTKNVTKTGFDFTEKMFITKEKDEVLRKGKLIGYDVVMTTRGTVGNIAYFDPNIKYKNVRINSGMVIIRANNLFLQPKFLYYILKNPITQEKIKQFSTGSAQPQLPISTIKKVDFSLPDLTTQKAIANILSSLDDKIELNNKINKNLEELAQTLYKQWFVDFEFPNEDGEPYKSSGGEMVESELGLIPKGWELSNLLEIANYMNGIAVKKYAANDDEVSLPVLKIKELGLGNVTSDSDRCNLSVPEKYIIKKGDLIFSWSGTLLVDFWTGSKSVLNQHLFKVSSNKYPRWFYYFWTMYHLDKFQNIAKSMATTMGHIKRDDLSKSDVLIPLKNVIEQGSIIFEPIIEEILKLRIKNNKLIKVRDELLPKLMSGEIEVPIEE